MSWLLRLFVVCLIALALPVQGIAAATRAHCGPSHQRMQGGVEPVAHQGAQPAHDRSAAHHDHGTAHAHHAADRADLAVEQPAIDPQAAVDPGQAAVDGGAVAAAGDDGAPDHLAKFKCSSCAACCVGSALARVMPRVPEPEAAATVFARLPLAEATHTTGGPDRPPRTPIA